MTGKSAAGMSETSTPDRRAFLRKSALTALLAPVAVGALASCDAAAKDRPAAAPAAPPPPKTERELADEMDRMHEVGIKAFPAKTAGAGNQLLAPRMESGERWDAIVKCDKKGTWAFHCHILPHAETQHGMFGMVTALVVG